uniref:MFS domain-containing protein n=1 Tax=Elaeophora elaphi TaxID=1147741 RepID=A0A0R3S792_9BILA
MESITNSFGSVENADQVLAEFGSRQRYILLITTLLSINWAIASMPVMHGTFIIDDDCFLNATMLGTNSTNMNMCMENSQKVTPISEFNLRGSQRYLVEWTTSAFMLGNMIGASSLTHLSDREGALLVGWVLSYESVPIGLRGFVTLIYGVMWVVGFCAVAPLVYFIVNWRWLMVAYSVPSIVLAIIYYFTIPESLHFLMVSGKKKKAAKWIRNAEKYGKVLHKKNLDMMVELLEKTYLDVKVHESDKGMTENLSSSLLEQLMEHKIFYIYTFVLIFLWTSDTFLYFGLSNYSIHLPGNKYWNYILSGLAELPAYITIPYVLEK